MNDANDGRPIVVGFDGSTGSKAALAWAVGEAARRARPVRAVTVHLPQGQFMIGAVPYDVLTPQGAAAERAQCARMLEKAVREATGAAPDVDVDQLVIPGKPGEELAALSNEAELLVVGSHGASRLSEIVLGSVSAYCVHHAACPVVVIPRRAWSGTAEHAAAGHVEAPDSP